MKRKQKKKRNACGHIWRLAKLWVHVMCSCTGPLRVLVTWLFLSHSFWYFTTRSRYMIAFFSFFLVFFRIWVWRFFKQMVAWNLIGPMKTIDNWQWYSVIFNYFIFNYYMRCSQRRNNFNKEIKLLFFELQTKKAPTPGNSVLTTGHIPLPSCFWGSM